MARSGHFLRLTTRIAISCVALFTLLNVASAADIKVLGGSAVIPAMEVLIPQFERASGHKVIADFDGAIGAMTKRIQGGEAADVVIVSKRYRVSVRFLEANHYKVTPTRFNRFSVLPL